MQQLLNELFGKVFRAKCPHGCEHAGDGVLFKFSKGKDKDTVDVLEIGLDYYDNLLAICTPQPGTSNNWVLLSVKNEFNPYTYAVHRITEGKQTKYEIYISREGTADNYPLEEVDPRYQDVEYYINRPSRKRSRHNSRHYSRSRSHSRSVSRSDSDDQNEKDVKPKSSKDSRNSRTTRTTRDTRDTRDSRDSRDYRDDRDDRSDRSDRDDRSDDFSDDFADHEDEDDQKEQSRPVKRISRGRPSSRGSAAKRTTTTRTKKTTTSARKTSAKKTTK